MVLFRDARIHAVQVHLPIPNDVSNPHSHKPYGRTRADEVSLFPVKSFFNSVGVDVVQDRDRRIEERRITVRSQKAMNGNEKLRVLRSGVEDHQMVGFDPVLQKELASPIRGEDRLA